ncbi:hypothetical protein A2W14_01990 [Candidatus Gottesmanbacteria bacterium RBG_16_37_8]|uniref:Cohesin domain-containing protein n=1 Tax=Candidatus Gottesmanbacteria bacterium RBG_16_37_8 TaxID=1798371 RepID=A0A1F5YRV3_9BACT|nr:MAG: hypothetical protein A2W14_01990 [Candidatus Gottesmanbacteria bacterium RBG_16_37_8]
MNKFITKFPLYLGLVVFILAVLVSAIKIGERGILVNNRLSARSDEAHLNLGFSLPNIISISLVSTKEISGADISLTYDSQKIEVLPSTLQGMTGFVTTGGSLDNKRGVFTFSAVTDTPSKTGIIATFRVRNLLSEESALTDNLKIDFVSTGTKVYDVDLIPVTASFTGL